MIEEFEKLPEIAEILESGNAKWCEDRRMYIGYDADFVNGALYAYQEQQKKIDSIIWLAQSEVDRWGRDKDRDQIAKGITIAFNSVIYHAKHIKDFIK